MICSHLAFTSEELPLPLEEEDESDPDEDFDVDQEMQQLTESIRLVPMRSLQYCYRHHREGLHTVKQERAMYGSQLDITVEYIRK